MSDRKNEILSRRICLGAVAATSLGLAGSAVAQGERTFTAIRRGKLKPGAAEEFAARVKAGALPVMKKMDGFRGYFLVMGADDTVIAISLFTNKVVAETSTQTLLPWIKENLGPLLASPTEAIDGEVVVSDVA
jgi:hypothetical protein